MQLSPDQQTALDQIRDWFVFTPTSRPYLTLGGYAGTGKTTILRELIRTLNLRSVACVSLTGKAVSVLKRTMSGTGAAASTIHSLIYRPILDPSGKVIDWIRKPSVNSPECEEQCVPDFSLLINDEASMTSEDLFNDLLSYGFPILFVGDHGQLPPIKGSFSLMEAPDIRLEKIHRQAADNPIIRLATEARETGRLKQQSLSDTVKVIGSSSFSAGPIMRELLTGAPDSLIITGTNRDRVKVNKRVLETMGRSSQTINLPFPGARLICLRNNYDYGIYNGQHAVVDEIHQITPDFIDAHITPDGGMPQRVRMNTSSFNCEKPSFDNRDAWFDFGYCITCHKAQGSQARRVFVLGSGFGDADLRRRWLYTAVTRAEEELYVIQ